MGFNFKNFIANTIGWAFTATDKPPYYQLQNKHLKNVVVLPTRLDMLKQLPKNAIVAEIGVAKGGFSEKIIKQTNPKKLHLVDSWRSKVFDNKAKATVQKRFEEQIKLGIIEVHHGDSEKILHSFPDKHFDWVYLDTDHTYITTKAELELCRHKVKPGGIIAGHDYTRKHYNKRYNYGVVEAVNEFCFKYNWEFIFLTHETHRHLSFALKEIL